MKAGKIAAGVLAVFFIALIFFFGLCGLLKNPTAVFKSVRFSAAQKYLEDPADTSFFPMTAARIESLENRLHKQLPLQDALSDLNAAIQYGAGKRMLVYDGQKLVRLPNGQLYVLCETEDLTRQAQEIIQLRDEIERDTPFLFSYINPGFFNGGQQLDAGYADLEYGAECAQQVLDAVRAAGIETMDSRTFFEGMDYTSDDLELKTDKHWTTLAALLAAPQYADKISEMTGVKLDTNRLNLNRFRTEVYPDLFMGTYGDQIGAVNADLDDITVWLPEYPTDITRYTEEREGDVTGASGDFSQSIFRRDKLALAEGKTYSTEAYTDYGLIEGFERLTNHGDCADLTVLVLRDSYTQPICGFLSLLVRQVVSADPRYCRYTATELYDMVKPDIVVVSFSRLILERHDYDLGIDAQLPVAEAPADES